jgi:hypothetical protein
LVFVLDLEMAAATITVGKAKDPPATPVWQRAKRYSSKGECFCYAGQPVPAAKKKNKVNRGRGRPRKQN